MRYLIGGLAALVAFVLSLILAWTIYLGIADSPYYFFVSAGVFMTDCVAMLLAVAAISAVRSE